MVATHEPESQRTTRRSRGAQAGRSRRARRGATPRDVARAALKYLTNGAIQHIPFHSIRQWWYRRVLGWTLHPSAAVLMGQQIQWRVCARVASGYPSARARSSIMAVCSIPLAACRSASR